MTTYETITNDYLAALVASYRDLVEWDDDIERLYSELIKLPRNAKASDVHIVEFFHCKAAMKKRLDNYNDTGILVTEYNQELDF